MAKNKKVAQVEFDEAFDFIDMDESYDDDFDNVEMPEVMRILMEASNHQMGMAVELTKLIVEKNLVKNPNEDGVFAVFNKASKIINERYNLNTIMEQLGHK